MNINSPIGVFDSGVGGLTVLKKLVAKMPNEDYLYFGDTARIPYGEKTQEQLVEFVIEILNWYKSKNVKAVLMACNTSSAVTLDIVKDMYDFPVLGLIQPAAEYISKIKEEIIGVIATSVTVNSHAYSNAVNLFSLNKKVIELKCPGLVEIVESGKIYTSESRKTINDYISKLMQNNVQKIVLGCTHYPYLREVIDEITNNPDMLIDPADFLVSKTYTVLNELNLLKTEGDGARQYFVSANPDKFCKIGNNFYSDCTKVEEINLNMLKL